MTQLLEQAMTALQKRSETEQDAIAALILEELEDERRWAESFAATQAELCRVAAKVRQDIAAGRVANQGIDEL